MRIPKKYGQSKVEICPFCSKIATALNKERVPVCSKHKEEKLPDLKCICSEYLDLKNGKFGPYFTCMNCGNINFSKAIEMNPNITPQIKTEPTLAKKEIPKHIYSYKKEEKKDIVVTSDELDFL